MHVGVSNAGKKHAIFVGAHHLFYDDWSAPRSFTIIKLSSVHCAKTSRGKLFGDLEIILLSHKIHQTIGTS